MSLDELYGGAIILLFALLFFWSMQGLSFICGSILLRISISSLLLLLWIASIISVLEVYLHFGTQM